MAKLSENVAVVTGGTGGLGRVVTRRLMEEGASVFIVHSGSPKNRSVIDELHSNDRFAGALVADVTNETEVQKAVEIVLHQRRKIDILCHCAGGVSRKAPIESVTMEEWNRMLQLNLDSAFLMMKHTLPSMKAQRSGRIIAISARPALKPEADRGGYAVAKAALNALVRGVAEEVDSIPDLTVNAIAPGIILTEENKEWGTEEEQRTWTTPESIAEMIVMLCSSEGCSIHGDVITMFGKT